MKIHIDCIPCFLRQSLDAARFAVDDENIHRQVLKKVLKFIKNPDDSWSSPLVGQKIHRIVRQLAGVDDPYKHVKRQFNDIALALYPKMKSIVSRSDNPLETAVKLAIAGNIIDFGVKGSLNETELQDTVYQCLSVELSLPAVDKFRQAVSKAQNILYLADNAGEIVFDRIMIQQLPYEKITAVVKGAPVINDATMEDAVYSGLTQIVEVIDNGSDAPGTVVQQCSKNFKKHFDKADLIIAKGQGNYETLSDVNKNIFFILKAKCHVIARNIGCEVGKMILQPSAFKAELIDEKI